MRTRIVFGSGLEVVVPVFVENVKHAFEHTGGGLIEFDCEGEFDAQGNPRHIFVNRETIAYIEAAEDELAGQPTTVGP